MNALFAPEILRFRERDLHDRLSRMALTRAALAERPTAGDQVSDGLARALRRLADRLDSECRLERRVAAQAGYEA
jgi:SOS response regulatory protein OraA/RecX